LFFSSPFSTFPALTPQSFQKVEDQVSRRRQQAAQLKAEAVAAKERSGEAERERAAEKRKQVTAAEEEKVDMSWWTCRGGGEGGGEGVGFVSTFL
jgi:hypothetical protein